MLVTYIITGSCRENGDGIREESHDLDSAIMRGKRLAKYHRTTVEMRFGDDMPTLFTPSNTGKRKRLHDQEHIDARHLLATRQFGPEFWEYQNAVRAERRRLVAEFKRTANVTGTASYREFRRDPMTVRRLPDVGNVARWLNPGMLAASANKVAGVADVTGISRDRFANFEQAANVTGVGAE